MNVLNLPKKCLLVDDDADDQEIFCIALKEVDTSITCVFANDGVRALEKLCSDSTFVPDNIFIDMNMPRMNGLECLAEIKKIERLKNTPVYIYSTSSDPKIIQASRELGATDFIVKPSTITALTNTLENLLKIKPIV